MRVCVRAWLRACAQPVPERASARACVRVTPFSIRYGARRTCSPQPPHGRMVSLSGIALHAKCSAGQSIGTARTNRSSGNAGRGRSRRDLVASFCRFGSWRFVAELCLTFEFATAASAIALSFCDLYRTAARAPRTVAAAVVLCTARASVARPFLPTAVRSPRSFLRVPLRGNLRYGQVRHRQRDVRCDRCKASERALQNRRKGAGNCRRRVAAISACVRISCAYRGGTHIGTVVSRPCATSWGRRGVVSHCSSCTVSSRACVPIAHAPHRFRFAWLLPWQSITHR